MPRSLAPRAGIESATRRLAMSINSTVGTLHNGAARFTSARNDTAIRSDGRAATRGLAMGIDIAVRTFNQCATRFASACSRAIGSNNCTPFASGTMRDSCTIWSFGNVPRRARFTSCSGVERV